MKISEAINTLQNVKNGLIYLHRNGKQVYFDANDLVSRKDYNVKHFVPDTEDLTSNDWLVGRFVVRFYEALDYVKRGTHMKRLSTGKKLDLGDNFTVDDIERIDWVIDDPEIDRLVQETAE
jgi:hypothetical protein